MSNPDKKFQFAKGQLPSISQIVERVEFRMQIPVQMRVNHIENPRQAILNRTGLDFGEMNPITLHYITAEGTDYEIKLHLTPSGEYLDVSLRRSLIRVGYLEGVVILSILDLGGWYVLPKQQVEKYIPAWCYFPYNKACQMSGFEP